MRYNVDILSSFSINLSAVADCVDYYGLFFPEHLINDTVITYTELVKSCKITTQCLKTNRFQILSQPLNTLNNAASHRLV